VLKGWDGAMGMVLLWLGGVLAGMAVIGTVLLGAWWFTWLNAALAVLITTLGAYGTREGI
jgi:hypothetical protein